MASSSVFFDVPPLTPATLFYVSAPLAVALFFQFSRVFSIRNLDVLTLYLFAPGLLLLVEASRLLERAKALLDQDAAEVLRRQAAQFNLWGYLWLIGAALYFLARSLADLVYVRRPALGANLNLSGLSWLTGSLFAGLITMAALQPVPSSPAEAPASPTDPVRKISTEAIKPYAPDVEPSRLRIWAERGLAVLCHLSVIVALILIGWKHFDDVRSGASAAAFYLLLPYSYLLLPDSPAGAGRWDHAWPMALVVWTIFTYRRPVLAGVFLGVATGTAPVLLCILPAWLSFYRGRGMGRFLTAFVLFAALGGAVLGVLLWLSGGETPHLLQPAWLRFDWQPWREPNTPFPGVWEGVHAAYRAPVFLASLALVITAAFWPSPKNLAHVLALSAAALLSVQLWYADRGGVYVLWFMPLLLLLVFRPNLTACLPPVPRTDDWLARLWRAVAARVMRLVRVRKPIDEKAAAG
jgi:hypothetical protein